MVMWGVSVLLVSLGVGRWGQGSLGDAVNRWGFRVADSSGFFSSHKDR